MDDRQLHWVQRNRSRAWAPRVGAIGPLSRKLLDSPNLRGPAWRRRLIAVVGEHAGPELLDQAELVSIRRGILTLRVSDAATACHLRLQWEQRLLQLLQARTPEAGITAIRFTVGSE